MSAPTAKPSPAQGPQLLRFVTCGSVDDGKSTLVGRLMAECGAIPDDLLAAAEADSRRWGSTGGSLDYALLLDGLAAEREQGITIDVAWRYFGTPRRRFIVADTPGHEQYTRNMVTGASTADLALLLVDATRGLRQQTRRHALLAARLGVAQLVLVVNKLDRAEDRTGGGVQAVFERIAAEFAGWATRAGLPTPVVIPVSALRGDNLTAASAAWPWYAGPTLLQWLETCPLPDAALEAMPLRLPVQRVTRPHDGLRGYAGRLAAGTLRPGQRLRVLPSGRESRVSRIVGWQRDAEQAVAGESVLLTLADEVDVARGDLLVDAAAPAEVADQFEAELVWFDDQQPLLPGRRYLAQLGPCCVGASVTLLKHRLDVDTLEPLAARTLAANEIGVVNLALDAAVPFDPYAANRDTGALLLLDPDSGATLGAAMLHFALRRAHNLTPQAITIDAAARARLLGQQPLLLWFTGLSGAGKSTIADLVQSRLHALGRACYLLDGDNLRHGLNKDLGFTAADRVENIRRAVEVAALMVDAGLIVLAAFISPFRAERELARRRLGEGRFIEVFVDVPLALAEQRDPKGLYAKARRGELKNFTGIDSPYEPPEQPELHLHTAALTPDDAAQQVLDALSDRGLLPR